MVACGIEGVLFMLMALFQCTPVQSFWNSAVPGHCINILAFFRAETAFNLVTNVAIILLPMPMVWRLHMDQQRTRFGARLHKARLRVCIWSRLGLP